MRLYGQQFGAATVARIRDAIGAEAGLTRSALSRRVCEWLEWRSPTGALREMSCRKALLALHQRGAIRLPSPCARPGAGGAGGGARRAPALTVTHFDGALRDLGRIELVPVDVKSERSRCWDELFEGYHPLGSGPLCGAQLRYLISAEHLGYLGGLAFSAAAWHLAARDKWIGWKPLARSHNLTKVVANSRFLILPTVRVAHLASHVLGMAAQRIEADWLERYGYAPVVLGTFVDEIHHRATSYRAANWVRLGETRGRGRNDATGRARIALKGIYAYPLCTHWRETLCTTPEATLRLPPPTHDEDDVNDWAAHEFASVDFVDGRLTQRLQSLARDFYARPTAPLNQACNGDGAKIKAAYRFLHNTQVNMDCLLKPHIEATARRIHDEPVALAVQDTTSLNYSTHHAMTATGPINTHTDGAQGLKLHDTLAFTPAGLPLGVVHIECWARERNPTLSAQQRKALPIELKESQRWLNSYQRVCDIQSLCPNTRVVSVGDRESDIYELFQLAHHHSPNAPDLLVRANHAAKRKTTADTALWAHLQSRPLAGTVELNIPGKGGRKARTATLDIRHAPVDIKPPVRLKRAPPITLWAIFALEPNPPPNTDPVQWLLLTTVETVNFKQACERLSWYAVRWSIEVYHRLLKSGCRIEDRRLGDAHTMRACLAIDLVVAWRIFRLTKLARTRPDASCEVFFQPHQWQALCVFHSKNPQPPLIPPTLVEIVTLVAKLGGYIGRKSDGPPGTTSLWRGLQRADDIAEAYKIFYSMPSGP